MWVGGNRASTMYGRFDDAHVDDTHIDHTASTTHTLTTPRRRRTRCRRVILGEIENRLPVRGSLNAVGDERGGGDVGVRTATEDD